MLLRLSPPSSWSESSASSIWVDNLTRVVRVDFLMCPVIEIYKYSLDWLNRLLFARPHRASPPPLSRP
jgi:hypothetical protein